MSRGLSNLPISNLISMPERAISPRLIHFGSPVSRRTRCTSVRAMAPSEGRDNNVNHLQRPNKQQAPAQRLRSRSTPVTSPVGMWNKFPTARTVQQMMETMERLMEDDPFAYSGSGVWLPSPQTTEESGSRRGRTPWEIKEREEEYKIRFDMPGMTKRDVKVWIEDKMLIVKAEKIPKSKDEDKDKDKGKDEDEEEEWGAESYGRYSNRIGLPENVEFEKIRAEVKNGVLYITIPKTSPRTKVLDINVK